jgi:erythronate-4-phosphate dehydrogenase
VWEREPDINWELFQAVTLGTPHIAGHSLDGKANGTFMIYTALCKHLGIEPTWNPIQSLSPPIVPSIEVNPSSQSDQELIQELVNTVYDIEADYRHMQKLLISSPSERPTLFDALRKNYPVRREFHQSTVMFSNGRGQLQQIVGDLGFRNIID